MNVQHPHHRSIHTKPIAAYQITSSDMYYLAHDCLTDVIEKSNFGSWIIVSCNVVVKTQVKQGRIQLRFCQLIHFFMNVLQWSFHVRNLSSTKTRCDPLANCSCAILSMSWIVFRSVVTNAASVRTGRSSISSTLLTSGFRCDTSPRCFGYRDIVVTSTRMTKECTACQIRVSVGRYCRAVLITSFWFKTWCQNPCRNVRETIVKAAR